MCPPSLLNLPQRQFLRRSQGIGAKSRGVTGTPRTESLSPSTSGLSKPTRVPEPILLVEPMTTRCWCQFDFSGGFQTAKCETGHFIEKNYLIACIQIIKSLECLRWPKEKEMYQSVSQNVSIRPSVTVGWVYIFMQVKQRCTKFCSRQWFVLAWRGS